MSSLQDFLEFFHGEEGGVEQNHLICERGHLIILIICSGCYLGIHPNLKFQKSNFSFRGAKSCLKQLRSINTTSPWHRRPLLHQRDKEVISASCLGDSVQTAGPATGRALLLGNWSAAVRGPALPEKIHCISVVQREVQCQAVAQANKPLFIRKRMLFVSDASLRESLLSIAADVLLTGHFIMLLTPWGMIPEECIINCFRGQAPGSAVTYCHCYWLRPISRFFQEHTHDRRRLRTVWLLLLHTDWHSWKGTELAPGRKSNQRQQLVPIRMHRETEAAERALGSYSHLQGSRLTEYTPLAVNATCPFTSFGGSFYTQIHLNYLKPLKGHLPGENTFDSVTVLQQIWDSIREFHELRGIS